MRPGRRDFQTIAGRERGQLAAKLDHLLARTSRIGANLRAQLDHRLMHLRLNMLFEDHLAVGQHLLNVRAQLSRLRIDDLEFLLDAESEDVIFRPHTDTATSLKKYRLSFRGNAKNLSSYLGGRICLPKLPSQGVDASLFALLTPYRVQIAV